MSQLEDRIEAVEMQFDILKSEILRLYETPPPRIAAALAILKLKIENLKGQKSDEAKL